MLCHPVPAAPGVPAATRDEDDTWCETRQRRGSPPAEGMRHARPSHLLLAGPEKPDGGSALGLNWFNVKCPVRSEKRDGLLAEVGLDDLMGYLLCLPALMFL